MTNNHIIGQNSVLTRSDNLQTNMDLTDQLKKVLKTIGFSLDV